MTIDMKSLSSLVEIADSGTWGDEATEKTGNAVLRSTNISENGLSLAKPAWRIISAADAQRRRLADGDIIVTKSSGSPDHIGKCAIFRQPDDGRYHYFSNFMLRLRAERTKVDPRWLLYWLTSDRGRAELAKANNTTTGLRNLSVRDYLAQRIPTPPLPEQRRIAAILDKADVIRRKRKEGIRLTEELLRSTFLKMFGDPETNPKGWEIQPVSEIVSEMEGGKSILADTEDTHSTQYRVLKVSAVTWADYRPRESKPVPADYNPPAGHIVKKGDLLFSRANTTELVGATVYVFDTPPNHLLPDKLWRFVWRDDRKVDSQYIRVLFMTSAIKRELGRRATGTSGSMKNISKAKLMTIPIPVPPMEIQRRFGKFALAQHKALTDRQDAAASTSDLFQALVQRAFGGEL